LSEVFGTFAGALKGKRHSVSKQQKQCDPKNWA